MSDANLDQARIEQLANEMLELIHQNHLKGPVNRDRVYESLNALAFCVAVVVRGSDSSEALEWFSDALNVSLKQ